MPIGLWIAEQEQTYPLFPSARKYRYNSGYRRRGKSIETCKAESLRETTPQPLQESTTPQPLQEATIHPLQETTIQPLQEATIQPLQETTTTTPLAQETTTTIPLAQETTHSLSPIDALEEFLQPKPKSIDIHTTQYICVV